MRTTLGQARRMLEAAVVAPGSSSSDDLEAFITAEHTAISQAVSLKRIADALEAIVSDGAVINIGTKD